MEILILSINYGIINIVKTQGGKGMTNKKEKRNKIIMILLAVIIFVLLLAVMLDIVPNEFQRYLGASLMIAFAAEIVLIIHWYSDVLSKNSKRYNH